MAARGPECATHPVLLDCDKLDSSNFFSLFSPPLSALCDLHRNGA